MARDTFEVHVHRVQKNRFPKKKQNKTHNIV